MPIDSVRPLAMTLALSIAPIVAQAGEVTLTGEGTVKYTPDSARLQFTASAQHNLAERASEKVNEQMAQWRRGIEGYRGRLQDYTDASVNLYSRSLPAPERGEVPEKVAVASQTVSFSIDDLSLLNPLLEQAQSIGMDYHLGPQQFFHSEEDKLQEQALARAIQDARERCIFVASQLEKQCGDVVNININGGHRPVPMMMSEVRAADSVISAVGLRELQASVSATFELD